MLSAPLVVGGSVVGDGSLEMVGDTITSTPANGADAPTDLSVRLFTLVPTTSGGYSAVLRFRTPIVVLHSWRGHAVRHTMTVVLRPPTGSTARAVQIQPDGTAMNGSFSSGRFQADAPGKAAVVGNVVVFDIPASFGATPDWTVQAIAEVQADEPLHSYRPATGYAAGTSIVPIGLLTGAKTKSSSGLGIADATTALTSATSVPTVTAGLRPSAVRLEGTGKKLTAVVTLDGPPSKLSAADHPHLDVDLALPGYATLDHPVRITWLPGGSPPATSAQVVVDSVIVGDVPVKVSGNEVAFALGAGTARTNLAKPVTPRLDELKGEVTIPLGLDEAASSSDGVRGPPSNPDSARFTVDGPRVAVTPASTGVTATGLVDVLGHFVATAGNDMYNGTIDQFGNVIIYRTTLTTSGDVQQSAVTTTGGTVRAVQLVASSATASATADVHESRAVPAGRVQISNDGDWNLSEIIKLVYIKYQQDLEEYKSALDWYEGGAKNSPFETRPEKPDTPFLFLGADTASAFASDGGDAQPGSAQAGNPDWPATPSVAAAAAGGDSTGTFVLRVSAGTLPQGRPIGVTTPWLGSHRS